MMKNIVLFILTLFCVACENPSTTYVDPRIPNITAPGDFSISGYTLSLFFSKGSAEAKDILSGDYIDYKNVYFYYLDDAKNVIKISTIYISTSESIGSRLIEDSSSIYSHGADIYAPFVGKGLSTIYLQKRNNKVDTLQIDVSKTVQDNKTIYTLNQITINSKTPRSFDKCHSLGYCYYLKP